MIETYVCYLDLDGVEADYASGMIALGYKVDPALGRDLNRSGTSHPLKREMYERIKGTEFYRHLPLQPGAIMLYRHCAKIMAPSGRQPIILTAAPKFDGNEENFLTNPHWLGAAYHKRSWVECVLLPAVHNGFSEESASKAAMKGEPRGKRIAIPDENFICTTSARKQQFIHRLHGEHQVLFDDRIANVTAWAEAGGIGIFHRSAAISVSALADFRRGKREEAGFERVGSGWLFKG